MPQYLSPGVYVEEVPSAIKPIAGVSTSTAAFIGIIPDSFPISPSFAVVNEKVKADEASRLPLKNYPVAEAEGAYDIHVPGAVVAERRIENNHGDKKSFVKVSLAPAATDDIRATYFYPDVRAIENARARLGGTDNLSLDVDFRPEPASVEA